MVKICRIAQYRIEPNSWDELFTNTNIKYRTPDPKKKFSIRCDLELPLKKLSHSQPL